MVSARVPSHFKRNLLIYQATWSHVPEDSFLCSQYRVSRSQQQA